MNNTKERTKFILILLVCAFAYGFSVPLLSLWGSSLPSYMSIAFMYFGATIAIFIMYIYKKLFTKTFKNKPFEKKERPLMLFIILADALSSLFLVHGLTLVSAETSSLLLSFQIVVVAVVAVILLKERLSMFGWIGLGLIVAGGISLSLNENGLSVDVNAIFILIPCILWGIQTDMIKKISGQDPVKVCLIKTTGAAIIDICFASLMGESLSVSNVPNGLKILFLGFITYGLAVCVMLICQRHLGASVTSCYFGLAPFIGSVYSLFIFHTVPYFTFYIAAGLNVLGIIFVTINEYLPRIKNHLKLKKSRQ
jgi:drug/metabolite transporter (DMT)-like permease